jgi:16S rRNA (guanine966-N2)-methyltransferase
VLTAEGLRPTPDRVRETLFNWLAPRIEGAHCLDLFAGTGALCLEALSRGAGRVVMVERSPTVAEQLRENVARLAVGGAEVRCIDALEYLAGRAEPFDVVFLDPPFAIAAAMIGECARRLTQRGWLKPGALVYIEAPRALKDPPLPVDWAIRKSGTTSQVAYHLASAAGEASG